MRFYEDKYLMLFHWNIKKGNQSIRLYFNIINNPRQLKSTKEFYGAILNIDKVIYIFHKQKIKEIYDFDLPIFE